MPSESGPFSWSRVPQTFCSAKVFCSEKGSKNFKECYIHKYTVGGKNGDYNDDADSDYIDGDDCDDDSDDDGDYLSM